MQCISVDFPDPEGPMTAVKRARSNATSTPSSAFTSESPLPYVLRRSTARAAAVSCDVEMWITSSGQELTTIEIS